MIYFFDFLKNQRKFLFFCWLPLFLACEFIHPIDEYNDPNSQPQNAQNPNPAFHYRSSSHEQNSNSAAHGEDDSTSVAFSPPSTQQRSNSQATSFVTASQGNTILVQKTCCPCRSGGQLIAISKSQEGSHNSNLRMRCSAHAGNCRLSVNCPQWKTQCQNSLCSTDVLNQLM